MRRLLMTVLIAAALTCMFAPWPRWAVEHLYSRGLYPRIQPVLTAASNRVPFALLDALMIAGGTAIVAGWIVGLRRRRGSLSWSVLRLAFSTVTFAAVIYLWFFVAWGMNYQREPLRSRRDFRDAPITTDALRALADRDVDRMNRLYAGASRSSWPEFSDLPATLRTPFDRAHRALGVDWDVVAGVPKRSLLNLYFRRVSVDGLTDPFFLETIANQSLLPFERPFVVAHEWGHLAGYADESEANFFAWLVCLRGGPQAEYSAWISLYGTIVNELRGEERRAVMSKLEAGPQADVRAMARRIAGDVNPRASRAGYAMYDRFLKANRVESGVRSYNEVVRLILGLCSPQSTICN